MIVLSCCDSRKRSLCGTRAIRNHQCNKCDQGLECQPPVSGVVMGVTGAKYGNAECHIRPLFELRQSGSKKHADPNELSPAKKIREIRRIAKMCERFHKGWCMRNRKCPGSGHDNRHK